MKRWSFLTFGVLGAAVLAPLAAHAATANFLGPIISDACNCPGQATGFGCVLDTTERAINFAISIGCVIATLIVVYGGFLFMTSVANPENRNKGMHLITGAFVGLAIALSAWLLVDFIMKTFYGGQFGPWNTILGDTEASQCIAPTETQKLFSGNIFVTPGDSGSYGTGGTGGGGTGGTSGGGYTGTGFTYQPGIEAQKGTASGALATMLTCMAGKVPGGVGVISSISDSRIVSGQKTFQECDQGGQAAGCAHHAHSCHYGGVSCVGSSYAVDFGDEQNAAVLTSAAKACGSTAQFNEGNHLHVSIGKTCGCN